ncbi:MAG: hypothetical protein WAR77_02205 [Saprospiraceae bacterium]
MKMIVRLFLLLTCSSLFGQNPVQSLKVANKDLYNLSDSLQMIEQLLSNGRIDTASFIELNAEILNQLSALAYSNFDNYARAEYFNPAESSDQSMGENTGELSFNMDSIPEENQTTEMPEFTPPSNPINLITGAGRRTSFKLRYGLFWNGLAENNTVASVSYPEFKIGKSFNWFGEFDILLQTKLGKNRGPFSIYYGIGFDRRHFTQDGKVQVLSLQNDLPTFNLIDSIETSTLHIGYFKFPVGMQYKGKSFVFNVGAYFGFLTQHEQSLEYKTPLGEEAELFLDKNYNFEKTMYGVSASIGYKRVHLAFNYDLSKLFKNSDIYDYNPWRVGIMIF